MRFTDVGQQGKVRPSLKNEVEADKLFPVFEVSRFYSQVGFFSNFNRTWSTLYFKLTLSENPKTVKKNMQYRKFCLPRWLTVHWFLRIRKWFLRMTELWTLIEMYQSFILIPINLFSLPRKKMGCLLTLIFEIHQAQDQSFIRSRELYFGLCNNTFT